MRDARYQRLQEPVRRIAYLPLRQLPEFLAGSDLVLLARTSHGPGVLREEVQDLDRAVPVRVETLEVRITESLVRERVLAALSCTLGGMALVLAAFSHYAMMAYNIARRTNEIGLRTALGASRPGVMRLVLREAAFTGLVGLGVGLGATMALVRIVEGLHAVRGTDPMVAGGAAGVLCIVMVMAAYVPARRAANLDPASALRME